MAVRDNILNRILLALDYRWTGNSSLQVLYAGTNETAGQEATVGAVVPDTREQ